MFQIVLVHPEIAPNTGNVIRLAANTGCRLHLVEPLGFVMTDRGLRRAGLDYHEYAEVRTHRDWQACLDTLGEARRWAITTRGTRAPAAAQFQPGDALVFGCESAGLPPSMLEQFAPDARLRLPMRPGSRSLNLGNSVAAVVYEAWRQHGYAGGA